ncbi:MAG: thiol reductant ABC exporter subunit CydD [Hoeflea sp.]|uniref:thiol reductant ABC exporter subunit CydD n=1 Tax=Hoeflea sp. TaxID=1940281 RepID=UPI001DB0FAEE|nr:thiol reductant ABC exporter subunit CydD [Hoeflea sp.]MBU4529685.1 thiol reductant ABC exporter subunit CydD [Alphaproteobacteria bacterium]MBU4546804.1 thiol reductant ABC exporter subunit CydD [Alphaproteobacteria bacterium]MBU4551072.1 thiol reductant ABC exporter subunit CydD [Alphaproteobacteria bacterium]MBV1724014.1 thiol reductant ABC exporter subunit CydD [Hoeflea sp.]MBV1763291.1 thiol reductant ABC exporter subunit CydD [Hoeflea sp.]
MAQKTHADPETDEQALDQLMRPSGRKVRLASVLTALSSLIWPLQAAIVALAIAGLLDGQTGPGALVSAAVFAGLGLIRAALVHHAEGILFDAGTSVVTGAREEIVRREMQTTDSGGAGSIAALASEKLDLLAPYITRYAPARARVMSVPLVILALSFWFSWAVGLVLLITGPLIPVFMALIGWAAKEASQRQLADIGSLNDLLIERLSALTDIRLLDAGPAVISGFADSADRLREKTMSVLRIAFLSSTVLELFAAIGVAMVAVYVGFTLLGAIEFGGYSAALSPAAGIFLLLLAPDFYQPLRDLSAAWHDKAAALAVAGELAAWRSEPHPELLGRGAKAEKLAGVAQIELRNVTAHPGSHLIRYPDITIRAGETVALTGPSGAGKTTLLRLLAGLSTPDEGLISVAGQPLDGETADAWRAGLGWMPQASHFLNTSVAQNISLGQTGDLDGALRAAAVEDVVAALPGGKQAHLGETGGGLSGGEARRITLARAIFAGPDVLLADEPTADLDATTAEAVMTGLAAFAGNGRTLIVATHDPVLAARMDRTIVIGGNT